MKNGLCYLEQRKPTTCEVKELPRQIMTSIATWDPSKFDDVVIENDTNKDKYDNDCLSLKKNIPSLSTDYSQLLRLILKTKNDRSNNDMNTKMLVRTKCPMISKTSDRRDKDRKLLYEAGHHPYPLLVTTESNKIVEAFSTNIDNMNNTKNDEEWDTSTYSPQETNEVRFGNNVRSATFSHPEKITIIDGNTGHIISEISLHTTDTVTLHNIGDKTTYSSPFPNINENGLVEQRKMPPITTKLKDMTIESSANKDDDDNKQSSKPRNTTTNDQAITSCVQPTMCALPSLAYNDVSPSRSNDLATIIRKRGGTSNQYYIKTTTEEHRQLNQRCNRWESI